MIIICVPNEFYNKSDSEIQRSELRNLVGNSIAQNAIVFRGIPLHCRAVPGAA